MAAMTDYLENQLIDMLFRNQTFTMPSSVYFGLHTSAPSDSAPGTEVSGGSYARVAVVRNLSNFSGTQGAGTVSFSSGTSGTISNNIDIIFPAPTANWGTVAAMGIYDASSGGNLLFYGSLVPSKTINSGDSAPKFSIGQFALQLDN